MLRTLEKPQQEIAGSSAIATRFAKMELALIASDERFQVLERKLELANTQALRRERKITELEAENRALREARWGTEELLRKEIYKLKLTVHELTDKLEMAEKQLVWFRTQKFGRTSEKEGASPKPATSAKDSSSKDNSNLTGKKNRGQQPGSKGHGRSDRSEVDTIVKYLDIPGGCTCGKCGTAYRLLAKTEASPLTEFEACSSHCLSVASMSLNACAKVKKS